MEFNENKELSYSTTKKPIKIPMPKNVVSPDDFKVSTGDIERAKKKYLELFNKLVDSIKVEELTYIKDIGLANNMIENILKF